MKARHILLIAGLCMSSFCCFGQQQLFDRFAGQDGVSSVHISKAMFDLLPSLGNVDNVGNVNLSHLKKIDGINILSTEKADVKEEMRKTFKTLITDKHEELMRIRDSQEDITFHIRKNKNGTDIEELIMLISGANEFTVIQILGHFSLKDIQDIAVRSD
ncbi:MAG: DUF4252 domain-containing protein [Tannerella sp.]|jgi:hypothetical protein|nr:DUF4252 domain-containing protein [Tannerella sp.]